MRQARKPLPPPLRWEPGTLPLGFQTRVDPRQVLLRITVHGQPVPKGRPRLNSKTGTLYTPKATVDAEREWRRVFSETYPDAPVQTGTIGALMYFMLAGDAAADIDNLAKTVADSASGVLFRDDKMITELHLHVSRCCPDPQTQVVFWRGQAR